MSNKSKKRIRNGSLATAITDPPVNKSAMYDDDIIDFFFEEDASSVQSNSSPSTSNSNPSTINSIQSTSTQSSEDTTINATINLSNGDDDNEWVTDLSNNENEETETKNRKKKSVIWKYCRQVKYKNVNTNKKKSYLKCQVELEDKEICGVKYACNNSTKNMKDHLFYKHNIADTVKEELNNGSKSPTQRISEINYHLMMFLITACLPFRAIENEYFKKFCGLLNSSYKLPTRRAISNLSTSYYEKKKNKLKEELKEVETINLTTDCWTSCQNFSYLSLTAHYLDKAMNLKSSCLAIRHLVGGHSSLNMARCIKEIVEEYAIGSKIRYVVTDNANSVIKAVDILKYKSIRCIGHILHLVVTSAFKAIKKNTSNLTVDDDGLVDNEYEYDEDDTLDIKEALESIDYELQNLINRNSECLNVFSKAIKKCQSIASLFNHSTTFKEKLYTEQSKDQRPQKAIIQQVKTRWNSMYMMLKSVVVNYNYIKRIILLDNDTDHLKYLLDDTEISYLKTCCEILEPLSTVSEDLSGQRYSTASLIIPSICILLNKTSENESNESDFKLVLKSIFYNKVKFYNQKYQILNNDDLVTVTFVNPKNKKFSNATNEEKNDLKYRAEMFIKQYFKSDKPPLNANGLIDTTVKQVNSSDKKKSYRLSDSSDDDKTSDVATSSVSKEIKRYLSEPKPDDQVSTIQFWQSNSKKFPTLFKLFKMFHSIPATSTPSERLFSIAGYQVWERRNKISPEKIEKIMFLFENVKT